MSPYIIDGVPTYADTFSNLSKLHSKVTALLSFNITDRYLSKLVLVLSYLIESFSKYFRFSGVTITNKRLENFLIT